MVSIYKNRRDLICDKLGNIKNIDYIYMSGAFYIFLDLSKIKSKFEYKESFSLEFCNYLLENYNVAIVPGIAFGLDNWVRISFACNENIALEAIDRLNICLSKF